MYCCLVLRDCASSHGFCSGMCLSHFSIFQLLCWASALARTCSRDQLSQNGKMMVWSRDFNRFGSVISEPSNKRVITALTVVAKSLQVGMSLALPPTIGHCQSLWWCFRLPSWSAPSWAEEAVRCHRCHRCHLKEIPQVPSSVHSWSLSAFRLKPNEASRPRLHDPEPLSPPQHSQADPWGSWEVQCLSSMNVVRLQDEAWKILVVSIFNLPTTAMKWRNM